MFARTENKIKLALTLATLAFIATAKPAQAQFNNGLNPFFLSGPRMLTPLGGGVVFNDFGNGFGGSSGISFGNAVASNGVNNAFTATTFTSTRPTFGRTGTNNSIPNGFQIPSTIVDPFTGSIRTIDQSLFFQANPGFSPLVVNAVNGSTVLTQGALNNQFRQFNNQPVRIFRAAPIFNPTIPNQPASAYAGVANMPANSMSASSQNTGSVQFPWYHSTPQTYPSRFYAQAQSGTVNNVMQSGSVNNGQVVQSTQFPWYHSTPQTYPSRFYAQGQNMTAAGQQVGSTQFPWFHSTPQTYPTRFYAQGFPAPVIGGPKVLFGGQMGFPAPVIGGPKVLFGSQMRFPAPVIGGSKVLFGSPMSSGTVVMGGRARR